MKVKLTVEICFYGITGILLYATIWYYDFYDIPINTQKRCTQVVCAANELTQKNAAAVGFGTG